MVNNDFAKLWGVKEVYYEICAVSLVQQHSFCKLSLKEDHVNFIYHYNAKSCEGANCLNALIDLIIDKRYAQNSTGLLV